jgi:hypothetical protein
MGKIFSPPKMPSAPTIIYESAAAKTTPTADTTASDSSTPPSSSTGDTPEPTLDELRVQDILTRSRGRLGTIGTSFRGVLEPNTLAPVRKTLLGE